MSSAKIPPKPGKETIYVDVDDEITGIIDKVDNAKEKVVALVLPKRATMLQSIVNMRLLKRSADKAGKSVVLITNEEALIPLAGAAGLHVAKNLQTKPEVPAAPAAAAAGAATAAAIKVSRDGKEDNDEEPEEIDTTDEEPSTKLDYHRSIGELAAAGAVDEAIDLEDDDEAEAGTEKKPKDKKAKTPKDKKLKVPNFDRFRMMMLAGIVLLILLIVGAYFGLTVLPKAKITITTGSIPVSANMTINASDAVKALDEKNSAITAAAKTTQQTQTQTVPATGQQNNGTKATGSVTMSAGTCGPNFPSDVAAGTGVSANGLTYITQQDASFSAHNSGGHCTFVSNSVPITAQQGGAKYNTGLSGASVSGAPGVSADGSAAGGTDNIVTVVSQTDVNNAVSKNTDAASAAFTKNFETQLANQGFYVFTSTLKPGTPATTANPAVGQPASTTTVTTTTTYTVLAVNKKDFTQLITDKLKKQIDPTKQTISTTNILGDATISVQSQASPSSATISVSIDTTAVPIIDVNKVKAQAVGQKVGDIKSSVQGVPGVKAVKVDLSPFWISKAPKASKITVVQVQTKDSGN